MAQPSKVVDWLASLQANRGLSSAWLQRAHAAGKIAPGMSDDDAYKAVVQFFLDQKSPGPIALPARGVEPDIRALIRFGAGGPGVPVYPARPTYYTPDMQANALAHGVESTGAGPRVTPRAGALIPSPIDPRRFTVGDPPPSTLYTPEMKAAAVRNGVERPFPAPAPSSPEVLNLPGPVATPDELAAMAQNARMYAAAAGRTDTIHAGADAGSQLIALGRGGPGVPVGGTAGGPRSLITTPTFADELRSMAKRGLYPLGGAALAAGAAAGGAKLAMDALGTPRQPQARADATMQTGGAADLANESRPVPVVTPTADPSTVAADTANPAAEAEWTSKFKRNYLAREARLHPSVDDLPGPKQQTVQALMKAGIPQQRANEIVRGNYSISPQEMKLLRSVR